MNQFDDKLELGRLLGRDVGRLCAFEDEVGNLRAASPLRDVVGAMPSLRVRWRSRNP